MTIRTLALLIPLFALPALSLAAAEPAGPNTGPGVVAETVEPDVWPGYAVPDADAARQGRSALPFTQRQIETLGRLLRQTQRATARGAGAPPQGRIRRVRLDAPGAGRIPVIALRHGYTTVLSFTGLTGAPWPIAEAVLDSRFLPPGQETAPEGSDAAGGHLLYLAPRQAFLDGNAVVTLAGLAEPVAIALRGTGGAADFRVDIRLGVPGPQRRSIRAGAARGVPRRRSGAARPARRGGPAGCRTAGRRRRGRPRLAAGRRSAADHARASADPRSLGGRTRPRRPLGLPVARYAPGGGERERP